MLQSEETMETCPGIGKAFLGTVDEKWQPGLKKRHKWFKKEKDFKVGDVVLVLSTESKQGKWILGRLSDVFPGKDDHVRVAKAPNCAPLNAKTLRGLINKSL